MVSQAFTSAKPRFVCYFCHLTFHARAPKAPPDLTGPVQPPHSLPQLCPGPRTPFQPPRTVSPCPSNAAARPRSSSPQPSLAVGPAQPGLPAGPHPARSRPFLSPGRCPMGLGLPQLLLAGAVGQAVAGGVMPFTRRDEQRYIYRYKTGI